MSTSAKEKQTTIIDPLSQPANTTPGVRAKRLADRIEEGARLLADLALTLSGEEWAIPVSEHDRRPVGVIVHHVASMYELEIGAVLEISKGNRVDVAWENIAQINAKHAEENPNATKSETIEFLRNSSRKAAEAVRALTDDELDQAAPFGLSFGAPVTAQFVIEDHPLRHSWHHLAKIREAIGR